MFLAVPDMLAWVLMAISTSVPMILASRFQDSVETCLFWLKWMNLWITKPMTGLKTDIKIISEQVHVRNCCRRISSLCTGIRIENKKGFGLAWLFYVAGLCWWNKEGCILSKSFFLLFIEANHRSNISPLKSWIN